MKFNVCAGDKLQIVNFLNTIFFRDEVIDRSLKDKLLSEKGLFSLNREQSDCDSITYIATKDFKVAV